MALGYARVTGGPGPGNLGFRPDQGMTVTDVTLDGSYSSGGYALSNASLGLLANPSSIDLDVGTAQGFTPVWDTANHKLKMFKSAGAAGAHAECAAGDLSTAVVVRLTCRGAVVV